MCQYQTPCMCYDKWLTVKVRGTLVKYIFGDRLYVKHACAKRDNLQYKIRNNDDSADMCIHSL